MLPDFDQSRPDVGQISPEVGQLRPTLARSRPKSRLALGALGGASSGPSLSRPIGGAALNIAPTSALGSGSGEPWCRARELCRGNPERP